eukprot:290168-Rhodomonas_salina.1
MVSLIIAIATQLGWQLFQFNIRGQISQAQDKLVWATSESICVSLTDLGLATQVRVQSDWEGSSYLST